MSNSNILFGNILYMHIHLYGWVNVYLYMHFKELSGGVVKRKKKII